MAFIAVGCTPPTVLYSANMSIFIFEIKYVPRIVVVPLFLGHFESRCASLCLSESFSFCRFHSDKDCKENIGIGLVLPKEASSAALPFFNINIV